VLNEDTLWNRVRGLSGETVYTLNKQKPNTILNVTEHNIEIENRKSRPSRNEIWSLYKQVYKEKTLYSGEAEKYTYAVSYAILLNVVPNEIEPIPGNKLGIQLKR
jgi:hypothetical protein